MAGADTGPVRVFLLYRHLSPHQVGVLGFARRELATRGFDVLPVALFGDSHTYQRAIAEVPRPPEWPCLLPDQGDRFTLRALGPLVALLRELAPSVIAVNGWADPVSWALVLAKRRLGARIVLVADSTRADRVRHPCREAVKRAFLKRVDSAFVAGSRQRDYLQELGFPAERIALGCDVVDNARFQDVRPRRAPDRDGLVIGTAARLVEAKNLVQALRALARIQSELDGGVTWRIAGQGPLAPELRALARTRGVDLDLLGRVPYDAMPDFYGGLELYWQPSRSEPWGLSINEAMASGLPVLASDRCGCADDLVDADNGWLHGVDSDDAVVDGLRRALTARPRWVAHGEASRRKIDLWGPARFTEGLGRALREAGS